MHWYIDGYNVTRTDPATKNLPLEEQRLALETRLRIYAGTLLGSNSYTIVWDGAGGCDGPSGGSRAGTVEFTRMDTADDSIVARVRNADSRVGVVTNDNELINRCKGAAANGVGIRPSDSLFERRTDSESDASGESCKGGTGDKGSRAEIARGGKGGSQGGKGRKGSSAIRRDVGIPAGANKINEELKRVWGIE